MNALILDLDGTLLHREEEEIAVPGFSGISYMAGQTAALLARISRKIPVIIATGRNARSVAGLTDQLSDIPFSAFVLENGLIARNCLLPGEREDAPDHDTGNMEKIWDGIAKKIPDWHRLSDYEKCLAFRVPQTEKDPQARMRQVPGVSSLHLYPEPGKMFVYPHPASKLAGVRALSYEPFIVLGDESNDLDILNAGNYAGTLASANPAVLDMIRKKGHFCSAYSSHRGTAEMLEWVGELLQSEKL